MCVDFTAQVLQVLVGLPLRCGRIFLRESNCRTGLYTTQTACMKSVETILSGMQDLHGSRLNKANIDGAVFCLINDVVGSSGILQQLFLALQQIY